jgi:hypothetical protein
MALYIKDPDSTLDFAFDWSSWLATGETISSHTVTVSSGITKGSDSEASGKVTVWLSGGTAGTWYTVACKIVTSAGRTDERTMQIQVKNR